MNDRPKRTDSEKEILEMQTKFFAEKAKNSNEFRPAAACIKIEKEKKTSIFAQKRKLEKVDGKQNEKTLSTDEAINEPEKHGIATTSDKLKNIILGDIIEKQILFPKNDNTIEVSSPGPGFPLIEKLRIKEPVKGKSLFAVNMDYRQNKQLAAETTKKLKTDCNSSKSIHLQDPTNVAKSIHQENIKVLQQMTEEEILLEKSNLIQSLDPSVIQYLQSKKKKVEISSLPIPMDIDLDSKENPNTKAILPGISSESNYQIFKEIPVVSEMFDKMQSEKWINFNVIEKEKLEWMKDIPNKIEKLKPGQKYEARFDWKGVLLPYAEEADDVYKDNRELYLHGDEFHRPGYSLQELFRLARSNITQQRISAFGAIGGILNIYNQGFYDSVLEIPITKIFFLLRFGFDENTSAVVEVVANSLANLLYNDTDETMLDLLSETSTGFLQPILEGRHNSTDDNDDDDIEKNLKNLKLSSTPFSAKIQDDDEITNKTSMSDFELAEINLIECLLRTNIIQRIYYILDTLKLSGNTAVISCFKILIRIARTNKDSALKIVSNQSLMNCLFDNFLPALDKIDPNKIEADIYHFPQYLLLKLFRVLMAQHISICIKLSSMDLIDRMKSYLFTNHDIKTKLIKIQIESFRIIRSIMLLTPNSAVYKSFVPAFRYLLEWHYQHLIYQSGSPFLIKQHASALLNAISSGAYNEANFGDTLGICCSKWFNEAKKNGISEFSQSILLTSCLNCISWSTQTGDKSYYEFIEKYLKVFICDDVFNKYLQSLSHSSIILKTAKDRRNIYPPLPNMGCVLTDENNTCQLIISQLYPVMFLNELFRLLEILNKQKYDILLKNLLRSEVIEELTNFLKIICKKINKKLATNFIAKSEISLIYKLICFTGIEAVLTKPELLQATFNILRCMTSEHCQVIEAIFQNIIFNSKNLSFELDVLKKWKNIYLESFVYPFNIIIPVSEASLSMPYFSEALLPNDWPYLLLKNILDKYLHQTCENTNIESEFPEAEIIEITFTFTELLESQNLKISSPTEKLMYLMIAFMSKNLDFLEPKIKNLLGKQISMFYSIYRDYNFEFDKAFEGKCKFENLYILFLDHFQGASYGDEYFSSLVMLPLSQKYDNKWRKIVWSEYASVLRFINCTENQLHPGSLEAYLQPIETDISLLKCYTQALSSNLLRINSIPYKIATHHVNNQKM